MVGKVVLVTGASGAVGKATSIALAREGAQVVMLCHDRGHGEAALDEVRRAAGTGPVPEMLVCDLAEPDAVRAAVAEFKRGHARLDALLNVAGAYHRQRSTNSLGWESMLATNHLGPFLLTQLLVDVLRSSAPARVVNVSAPVTTKVDFQDLMSDERFSAPRAFGASKMCGLLSAYALARRFGPKGVTANVFHPGLVKSDLMRETPKFLRAFIKAVSHTPAKAGDDLARLAVSPVYGGANGKFFKGRKEMTSSAYSLDPLNQDRLWDASVKLLGLQAT